VLAQRVEQRDARVDGQLACHAVDFERNALRRRRPRVGDRRVALGRVAGRQVRGGGNARGQRARLDQETPAAGADGRVDRIASGWFSGRRVFTGAFGLGERHRRNAANCKPSVRRDGWTARARALL
jgi:hypothetical protein